MSTLRHDNVARRTRTARRRPAGIFALAVLALVLPFGANATVTVQEGLVSWYGETSTPSRPRAASRST